MDDDTAQAMYHHDMQQFQQQATEALRAASTRPLTEEEQAVIAWMAGIGNDWRTEKRA